MNDQAIVVGAGGSDGSDAAVRFAAEEADRLGLELRIVHATPDRVPLTSLAALALPFAPAEMEAVGRSVLARARAIAAAHLPPERIHAELRPGEPTAELLAALGGARCVVLGDDRRPQAQRVATGSTVAAVAARAGVPVIAVPSDWEPWHDERVAVGIKGYADLPTALLTGALRMAAERDAVLEIVHVWCPPAIYADQLVPLMARPDWAACVEQEIRARAARVLAEFAGTRVVVSALYGDPTHVLQEVSAEVDLLVLARHEESEAGHFGSVSQALFHGAQCPVVVLPVAEESSPPAAMPAAG